MGFERGSGQPRKGFRNKRPIGGARRFRKGSGDLNKNRDGQRRIRRQGGRRDSDNDQRRRIGKGRRIIRKRREEPLPKDKEDAKNLLDRQMRQYWVKSGSSKGKEEATKDTNLATKKMNQEMDEYWKKAKEKKQQPAQSAAQKKVPQA